LVDLKEYLLAWGAQDEKVIEEWAPSRWALLVMYEHNVMLQL
jgi:hypothetical protein